MTRRRVAASVVVLTAALWAAPPAGAAGDVRVAATIDGRPLRSAGERDPIRLRPKEVASLEVRVTNDRQTAVDVRTVRLHGEVMALTFFAYDTSVNFTVAPGATESRTFELDLAGLGGQATGLIRGSVSLLDARRDTLASERMVVDVRGSVVSVYGLFGLALILLTAFSLGGALLALARHQLPANRWRRGVRFLTPGLGLGLLAVFTLSALRIFVPRPRLWIPILLVSGAAFLLLGYLTPAPDDEDDGDDTAVDDEAPAEGLPAAQG